MSEPRRFCPICEAQLDVEVCPTDLVPTVRADFDRRPTDEAIGKVIAGRFRIERLIGEGGAGRVYEAVQLGLGRVVALKLLHPRHAADRTHVRRFYREARAATRLSGPHVVRVYDFGVDDDTRTPFIAMELLAGATLKDVARQRRLSLKEIAGLGAQIGRALTEAAAAGIVHRDLKPSNILWVEERGGPCLKVTDFGVAKELTARETDSLTAEGAAVGTPTYMAPEQVSGGEVDPRADLYALGCILYELVADRPPFSGEARAEVFVDHLLTPPPPMPARRDGEPVPAALAELVARLLAKTPGERPADAEAVVATLEVLAGERVAALLPVRRKGPGRGATIALGVALVIAGGAVVIESAPSETESAAARPADGVAAPSAPAPSVPAPSAQEPAALAPAAGAPASVPEAIEHLVVRGASATIRVHDGEAHALVVNGDASRVATAIEGGRLTISVGPPAGGTFAELAVDVWAPRWKSIKVTGTQRVVSVRPLAIDELSLALSGSARADLELAGESLVTSMRGSSEVILRGAVTRHEARTGGASRLDAHALASEETSLVAGGTSDASVAAKKRLDARNEGTGEVEYVGRPVELVTDGEVRAATP